MTRLEAVAVLLDEARKERASKTAYKRCVKALNALGFEADEQNAVLAQLEYHDLNGNPYKWLR
jgi:Holliday junction resolvasome RuvABC DNA-binding subunit